MRFLAAAAFVALLFSSATARAGGLSADEADRLMRGESVSRTQDYARGGMRYVGGVTYAIVDTAPDDLATLVQDVAALRRFMPKTRDAQRVGTAGSDELVEFTHGSVLVKVAYTLRIHQEGRVVRFWMDPTRAHDIEDAWGYFRADPMPAGRTLLTFGILIDMGDGLLRDMLEDRVRELALELPDHLRDLVVERNARGRRASSN
ncbi:MAG TPA: hypothetical protein VIF15_10355 [Polyangiaceae bacterium]